MAWFKSPAFWVTKYSRSHADFRRRGLFFSMAVCSPKSSFPPWLGIVIPLYGRGCVPASAGTQIESQISVCTYSLLVQYPASPGRQTFDNESNSADKRVPRVTDIVLFVRNRERYGVHFAPPGKMAPGKPGGHFSGRIKMHSIEPPPSKIGLGFICYPGMSHAEIPIPFTAPSRPPARVP